MPWRTTGYASGYPGSACWTAVFRRNVDDITAIAELFERNDEELQKRQGPLHFRAVTDFKTRAAEVYETYATQLKNRFKWLRSDLFVKTFAKTGRRCFEFDQFAARLGIGTRKRMPRLRPFMNFLPSAIRKRKSWFLPSLPIRPVTSSTNYAPVV